MENHHFQWVNPPQIVIFHSDVKLPEGTAHMVVSRQALVTLIECFVILIIVKQSDWPKYAELLEFGKLGGERFHNDSKLPNLANYIN